MKCPNALKTQSKCGETFLRKKKKKKILKSWKIISGKRGNCNNKIFPTILPFDMTMMKKKFKTKKKC
jgi:hypothetical protein